MINSLLMGLVGLLNRIPIAGKATASILFLILDILVSFGDLSFLIGMPAWIPIIVGTIIVIYLSRLISRAVKKRRSIDKPNGADEI